MNSRLGGVKGLERNFDSGPFQLEICAWIMHERPQRAGAAPPGLRPRSSARRDGGPDNRDIHGPWNCPSPKSRFIIIIPDISRAYRFFRERLNRGLIPWCVRFNNLGAFGWSVLILWGLGSIWLILIFEIQLVVLGNFWMSGFFVLREIGKCLFFYYVRMCTDQNVNLIDMSNGKIGAKSQDY